MSERPFSQEPIGLVVAHRGASLEAPENTLDAFDRAVAAGAGAVEFDVRVTADDRGVVIHDATVDRTTEGTGRVRDLSRTELQRLPVRGGGRIPSLEEALELLSGRAAIDVEIKNVPGEPDFDPGRERAVELVHEALDAVAFVGDVIISSFNPLSLAASKLLRPEVATGLLTSTDVDARAGIAFAATQGHGWALPFIGQVESASEDAVTAAREAGVRLGTWLTDDPAVAAGLFRSGIDAVATNDPRRVVAALSGR